MPRGLREGPARSGAAAAAAAALRGGRRPLLRPRGCSSRPEGGTGLYLQLGWSYRVFKGKTAQALVINHLRGSATPVLDPHTRARQTGGKREGF